MSGGGTKLARFGVRSFEEFFGERRQTKRKEAPVFFSSTFKNQKKKLKARFSKKKLQFWQHYRSQENNNPIKMGFEKGTGAVEGS